MSALSNTIENELLDHLCGVGAYTMPAALYAALHTADPTEAGGVGEVSGNGYARQTITFGAASNGAAANSSAESFVASGGDWGTISYGSLWTASSGGTMLMKGGWSPAIPITNGDTFAIQVGDIVVTIPATADTKLTNYTRNKLLDHILGVASFAMPTPRLGLFTVAPSVTGGGTEVSGNGYARQTVTFGAASGGAISNTAAHTFTASGGNWGTLTHWGLFDADSAGNLLAFGQLSSARVVNDGGGITIAIGAIDLTLD